MKHLTENAVSKVPNSFARSAVHHTHPSRLPGVMSGVSPTLRLEDFFAFFSKYFLANAFSFAAYSFSIIARSR